MVLWEEKKSGKWTKREENPTLQHIRGSRNDHDPLSKRHRWNLGKEHHDSWVMTMTHPPSNSNLSKRHRWILGEKGKKTSWLSTIPTPIPTPIPILIPIPSQKEDEIVIGCRMESCFCHTSWIDSNTHKGLSNEKNGVVCLVPI